MNLKIGVLLIVLVLCFTGCKSKKGATGYKKVPKTNLLTNQKTIELVKVHDKSWCDSQPVVIENFFNSYNNSFETLMSNSDSGDEYCIKCESTTYLSEYLYLSSCD